MSNDPRLLMISAMYENGGNTTQRFLDGHPQMLVYPFESQIGTRFVVDALSSLFPLKYRWPVFPLHGTARDDYHAIIDEEGKVRSRTPSVSKFRDADFQMSDDERRDVYVEIVERAGRSRPNNVMAFFEATFRAWKNVRRTSEEFLYVGYSPIITVDGQKILDELPDAHMLSVVRNPWSAYADTKKRPVPLSIEYYMLGWTLHQQYALRLAGRYPSRFHILRFEDLVVDPRRALGEICAKLGCDPSDSLATPSWNGTPLPEVYPWGTIRKATPEANRATARELSGAEQAAISEHAALYLDAFDYRRFL